MPVSGNTGTTTPAATQETSSWFITVDAHGALTNNTRTTANYIPNTIDTYNLPTDITVATVADGLPVTNHSHQLNNGGNCKVELINNYTEDIYIWVTLIPIFHNGSATSVVSYSRIQDGASRLTESLVTTEHAVNGASNPGTNPRSATGYVPRWTECRRVGAGETLGLRCSLTGTGGIRIYPDEPYLVLASATIEDWIKQTTQGSIGLA